MGVIVVLEGGNCFYNTPKENVIVGRLIPAGTGSAIRRLEGEAAIRDELLVSRREKEEELKEIESS